MIRVIIFIIELSITYVNEDKNKCRSEHRSSCSNNSTICIRPISSIPNISLWRLPSWLRFSLFLRFIQSLIVSSTPSSNLMSFLLLLAPALIESEKNSGCKSQKTHPYRYFMIHMLRDSHYLISDVCHNDICLILCYGPIN